MMPDKSIIAMMVVFGVLTIIIVSLDVYIDQATGHSWPDSVMHVLFGLIIIVSAHAIMRRAMQSHKNANDLLARANEDLEERVRARTAELDEVNQSLRNEIAERKQAETEREQLISQIEGARQRAEMLIADLHLANNMLVTLIDTLPAGMVIIDANERIVLANSQARDLMHSALAGDEFALRDDLVIRDSGGRPIPHAELPLIRAVRNGQAVNGLEVECCTEDGACCYWLMAAAPVQDENGRVVNAVQIMQDISERRRIEDAVRLSEERFSTVFHLTPNPVAIVRAADGSIVEINQALAALTGLERKETIGQTWEQAGGLVIPSSHRDTLRRLYQEKGSVYDYEIPIQGPNGQELVLLLSMIPITLRDEACLLIIGHDITARKRSEEALRLAQAELERGIRERSTLQERQRLARELHDSVSQALYGISLGAHTALTLFDSNREKTRDAISYILSLAQAGLTEMRALIFELRPESLKTEGLVAALAKQTAALRSRHSIELNYSSCGEPAVPLESKEALYRIAQEALQNAVKHAQPTRIDVELCSEEDCLRLEVRDNGRGFNPSDTFPGHLGLHSMRERAAMLGGRLEINSLIGLGTTIKVWIPAAPSLVDGEI